MRPVVHHLVGAMGLALLGGCAVAPMAPETYASLLNSDSSRISTIRPCCVDWKDVDFSHELTYESADFVFGSNSQVRDFGGYKSPLIGLKLADHTELYQLEVFSFSDARHGAMRFDDRLFVRPDLYFLDSNLELISSVNSPPMCWGTKERSGGVWYRQPIPKDARYVVLSPSTKVATQSVDTRVVGPIPPGIQMISDARGKTYISSVAMGYTGLISARITPISSPPLGRCVEPATPTP